MFKIERRTTALILTTAILVSGVAFMALPAAGASSFDNVQIFATTSASHSYSFEFAAYNLTGSLIASTQTSYPAASFELPAGGYLFTVSATDTSAPYGIACPLSGGAGASTGTATATPGKAPSAGSSPPMVTPNNSTSVQILPACYPPSSEYGYATSTISGAQTIGVTLQNVTTLATTPVTVRVSYVNGTAASNASVSASIVGEWYFWWGADSSVVMNAQTDSNGVAHLVLPVAPAVVTSWKWVPVSATVGSNVTINVGGQNVNVTMYWEPTYVGLSGSGLLLPPANAISITLRYQRPDYWVLPQEAASTSAGTPSGTVASQPSGVPTLASSSSAQSSGPYLPSQIPSIQQEAAANAATGQAGVPGLETLVVAGAVFFGAALVVLLAIRYRTHRPPPISG